MKVIKQLFNTKNSNRIVVELENPTQSQMVEYCKDLEDWTNLFVVFTDGEIISLRRYLLDLLPQ